MFLTAAVSCVLIGELAKRVSLKLFLFQLVVGLGGLSSLLFPFCRSYAHLMVYMIIQGVAYSHRTLLSVIPLVSKMLTIQDNADAIVLQAFIQIVAVFGVPIAGRMSVYVSIVHLLIKWKVHLAFEVKLSVVDQPLVQCSVTRLL